MLKYLFLSVSMIMLIKSDPVEIEDLGNPMKYKLPYELPDQNQDGFSDNQDFQRAFKGLNLTRYEISTIFEVTDIKRRGKVTQKEWSDFYLSFITPFEEADAEPRDGVLDEEEVKKSLEDIADVWNSIMNGPREHYLTEIMETLTSRTQATRLDGRLSLNLNEYIFLRRAAIAWAQCGSQANFISKSGIQTCASPIMLPNIHFSENQQQMFFHVLKDYSRWDEKVSDSYKFLAFLSIFHKYDMFMRIGQNKLHSGALNWRELEQAATDSEGPSQKLQLAVLDTVFSKLKTNLEFTGLDFKQFFILMQSIDFIYIFGQTENGYLKQEEWLKLVEDKLYSPTITDNIDDCYVDKEEKDEKPVRTNHWAEQKLLTQAKRRRFARVIIQSQVRSQMKMKLLPANEDSRKAVFGIYDLNEDGQISAGELFLFHKFAAFFQAMAKGDIHLIYSRNLDFDVATQIGQFEIALFKEEQYQLNELQRWMRSRVKFYELGLNFIQFGAWFQFKQHFVQSGQQSLTAKRTPFPSYRRSLEYMGFKVHKKDIENSIFYSLDKPDVIPAQKYDLDAYLNDGAFVDFTDAFTKNLERYSRTFMKEKWFTGKAEPVEV